MAVTLVHTSDIHIDDEPIQRSDSGLGGLRAVLTAADALAADILVLAGDTFDNHRVSAPVLRRTAELLSGAGRPVVVLPGNHDPALADCLFQRAGLADLPHLHILGVNQPETIQFPQHDLEITGRAHRSFNNMPPLRSLDARTTRWRVVVAHGHYVPDADWQKESHRAWRIGDADLADLNADYVALGHWDRATAAGPGRVQAYYSGSPDLARSINLVHLHQTEGVTVSRVPLTFEL